MAITYPYYANSQQLIIQSYTLHFSSSDSWVDSRRMCGHTLSGSPLVHRILRSPRFLPSARNVPALWCCSKLIHKLMVWYFTRGLFTLPVLLTEGKRNNVKECGLAMTIHQVQCYICSEKACSSDGMDIRRDKFKPYNYTVE